MEKRKLLITDMDSRQLKKHSEQYDGWTVLNPDQEIHPCIGCFTCWKKTPGRCVFRDGFEEMAALINEADEIVYSSRFTYGGFSNFVKNVFDRSIGYVLPYFEVSDHEMHHQRRYDEIKNITFIFRGNHLNQEEKEMAINYVNAVCRNMRNNVKEVLFEQEEIPSDKNSSSVQFVKGKTVLLNCSMRGKNANSEKFLTKMAGNMKNRYDFYRLSEYRNRLDELINVISPAETLVLAMPLYVDGFPSNVIRFLEKLEEAHCGQGRKIYILANLGLYESHQLKNLLSMVRYFCLKTGYQYQGAAAVGAGELVSVLIDHMKYGPVKNVTRALSVLAEHIDSGESMDDMYAQPFLFPRWLYIQIANRSWDLQALSAGIKPRDLRIRPERVL